MSQKNIDVTDSTVQSTTVQESIVSDPSASRHKSTIPLQEIRFGDDNRLSLPEKSKNPVTVFARHKVIQGKEPQYETWAKDLHPVILKYPGFLGSEVIRPACCESREYVAIFRFDTYDHLQIWMDSSDRKAFLDRACEFEENPIQITYHSLEYWFHTDSDAPPPRIKMVVVTWLVIWAQTALVAPNTIGMLNNLPHWLSICLSVLLTVVLTTYVVMPIVVKYILHWWLYPKNTQPCWIQLNNCSWRPIARSVEKHAIPTADSSA